MIRIAVCDDEPNIRQYLTSLIQAQHTLCETEIIEYASTSDFLAQGQEFDLLFLDIEMDSSPSGADKKDGTDPDRNSDKSVDGMELARQLRSEGSHSQPLIIFVTGYEKYVYDAFDVDAFQYLLKPVDEQRFSKVYDRAVRRILAQRKEPPDSKSLLIQYEHRSKTIPLENIYYIESRNHKVVLHLKEGPLSYYARIGDLEAELQDQFCRIHKGYLINLSYVDSYTKTEVELTNGETLLISRYKYPDFVKAYLRFVKGRISDE